MRSFLIFLVTACGWAQSAGSLFIPAGRLADAVRDVRAGVVDDIVTVIVSENLTAVASGATNSSRKSSAVSNINAAYGLLKSTARIANPLNISGDQELAGTGSTSRNMTLQTTISARVVKVLDNGNLEIEATRDIGVNSEKQSITIHGMVRPADLTPNNMVTSTQVADLTVKVNGKGVVGDAIRRPHFLYRLLLGLLPF